METHKIREQNRKQVETLGYRFNPNLPVLDPVEITRRPDEVVGRILGLNACVACSYGFPKTNALKWLAQEKLMGYLSELENRYLRSRDETDRVAFQWQVETLWALTWAAGYHDQLDFSISCPDTFVGIFPDLKTNAPSDEFVRRCKLRARDDILKMVDLAYCLHWTVRDEALRGQWNSADGKIPGQIIVERRRGLEWLVSDEDWDYVLLDT